MNSLVAAPATPRAVGALAVPISPPGRALASTRAELPPRALPSRALARPRDARAAAWLGDWMRENFGDDESKSKSKSKVVRILPRGAGSTRAPSRARNASPTVRTTPRRLLRDQNEASRRPSKSPPPAAFDELTPEELRPDFGLRRDLYDLYEVKSLDDEEPIGAGIVRHRAEGDASFGRERVRAQDHP